MVNNISKTTTTLDTNLGAKMKFDSNETIQIMTGEIGLGLLVFDPAGTLGVISEFIDVNNFSVTTFAVSIDIQKILSLEY